MAQIEVLNSLVQVMETLDQYYYRIAVCLIILLFCMLMILLLLIGLILSHRAPLTEDEKLTEISYQFLKDWNYEKYKEEKKNANKLQHK